MGEPCARWQARQRRLRAGVAGALPCAARRVVPCAWAQSWWSWRYRHELKPAALQVWDFLYMGACLCAPGCVRLVAATRQPREVAVWAPGHQ